MESTNLSKLCLRSLVADCWWMSLLLRCTWIWTGQSGGCSWLLLLLIRKLPLPTPPELLTNNLDSRPLLADGEVSAELFLFRTPLPAAAAAGTVVKQGDPGSEDPDGFDPAVIDDMPSKSRMSCHSFESVADGCCCLGEVDGTQSPLLSAAAAAAAATMAPWTAAEAVAMATTVVAVKHQTQKKKKKKLIKSLKKKRNKMKL